MGRIYLAGTYHLERHLATGCLRICCKTIIERASSAKRKRVDKGMQIERGDKAYEFTDQYFKVVVSMSELSLMDFMSRLIVPTSKGLFQIGYDVFDVLNTDREPYQIVGDACF